MNTREIAERLHELCSQYKFEQAQRELYAADALSLEPDSVPEENRRTQGLDNIIEKGNRFQASVQEVHGAYVGQPVVTGRIIAMPMSMDMTFRGMGRRKMEELCVYEVQDGKIIKEQFFF